jgi:hypothetical protein
MRQTKVMVSIQDGAWLPGGARNASSRRHCRTRGRSLQGLEELADGTSSLASVECRVKTVDEAPPP